MSLILLLPLLPFCLKMILCWLFSFTCHCHGWTCLPVCWEYSELHLQPCPFFSSPISYFCLLIKSSLAWSVLTSDSSWTILKVYVFLNQTCCFSTFSLPSLGIAVSCVSHTRNLRLPLTLPLSFLLCPVSAAFATSLNSVLFFLYFFATDLMQALFILPKWL